MFVFTAEFPEFLPLLPKSPLALVLLDTDVLVSLFKGETNKYNNKTENIMSTIPPKPLCFSGVMSVPSAHKSQLCRAQIFRFCFFKTLGI